VVEVVDGAEGARRGGEDVRNPVGLLVTVVIVILLIYIILRIL
jgi:hypothetical protein